MTTPNIPKVERVEVHGARAEAADLRKIHHNSQTRGTSLPEVTFVYKVYVRDRPAASGRALELFIGDHQVRKYSGFAGGLFFTINDPELAERLAGGAIRLRVEGTDEMIDTGVAVPSFEPMRDLLKDAADVRTRPVLPSQQELLRK